jgi:hypothetical protein
MSFFVEKITGNWTLVEGGFSQAVEPDDFIPIFGE